MQGCAAVCQTPAGVRPLVVALVVACGVAGWGRAPAWAQPPTAPRLAVPADVNTTRPAAGAPAEAVELPAPARQYRIPLANEATADDVKISSRNGLITLYVRDAPLRDVLSVLARTQGLNIVCAESVTARVAITLESVRLEDALNSLLAIGGYTWTERNRIIYVTSIANSGNLPPEVQGRRIEVFPLNYASAPIVDQAVQGMLSPAGRSYVMQVNPADNRTTQEAVVVEDLPTFIERIRQYIWQVDQMPRQVLIEAHILEIDLKDEQKHGVNFENMLAFGGNSIKLQMSGFANAGSGQAFLAEINGAGLNSLIEFLQTTTDAKTLASPKVLVVNGQTARIQVGEKLGFLTSNTTQTSTQQNVSFLNVGVLFEVTPRVTPDNRVLMRVKPEVSTGKINPDTGLPEAKTTEVATDVMLGDGNGIVIGGLIQEKDIDTQNKLPFLGDIKYIGRLFQRRVYTKSRSEIIMTLVARVLPYCPEIEQREQLQAIRTQTPVLYGPLERYPRPWEPSLRDAMRNPQIVRLPPISNRGCLHTSQCQCQNCRGANVGEPTPAVPEVYVAPAVTRLPTEVPTNNMRR